MNEKETSQKQVNWDTIKKRLEKARAAFPRETALRPEALKTILTQRARELSSPLKAPFEKEGRIQILAFTLAHESYGVLLEHVAGVQTLKDLTPVPGTPDFILGIIQLKGQILSVVDLKTFFNLPHKGLTHLNKIVVLENETMAFGLLVDEIIGAQFIPSPSLQTEISMFKDIRKKPVKWPVAWHM